MRPLSHGWLIYLQQTGLFICHGGFLAILQATIHIPSVEVHPGNYNKIQHLAVHNFHKVQHFSRRMFQRPFLEAPVNSEVSIFAYIWFSGAYVSYARRAGGGFCEFMNHISWQIVQDALVYFSFQINVVAVFWSPFSFVLLKVSWTPTSTALGAPSTLPRRAVLIGVYKLRSRNIRVKLTSVWCDSSPPNERTNPKWRWKK